MDCSSFLSFALCIVALKCPCSIVLELIYFQVKTVHITNRYLDCFWIIDIQSILQFILVMCTNDA